MSSQSIVGDLLAEGGSFRYTFLARFLSLILAN